MKNFFLVVVLLALVGSGLYYAQYKFGIQIPKVNSVTGDTCGIVIYHNIVLDFSNWDPHKITGYLTPDIIPNQYQISETWGGVYLNSDGTNSFGFGFLNGYCYVKTGEVVYSGDFMFSLPQKPGFRLPFTLLSQ